MDAIIEDVDVIEDNGPRPFASCKMVMMQALHFEAPKKFSIGAVISCGARSVHHIRRRYGVGYDDTPIPGVILLLLR